MTELKRLAESILDGDAKTAVAVTKGALAEGVREMELLSGYMIPAMDEVGQPYRDQAVARHVLLAGSERCPSRSSHETTRARTCCACT